MHGKFFGLGELPTTPLNSQGGMAVNSPHGLPPLGNTSAPVSSGGMRMLGDNQSVWQFITFTATATPFLLQSFTYRKFLLLQNKSGAGTIFIGFGYEPNAGNGLVLPPGVGYEPYNYPVNEIYVSSDGPAVDGLLIFGT